MLEPLWGLPKEMPAGKCLPASHSNADNEYTSCDYNQSMSTSVRQDRERGANLITRWLGGSITTFEFDDNWPYESQDAGVVDIGRELWSHYIDNKEHLLNPADLSPDEVTLLKRCLGFLRSNADYVPVPYEEAMPWKPSLLTKVFGPRERPWETLRLVVNPEREKWWPFKDSIQYDSAMESKLRDLE
jgi:hypothetical protein